MPANRCLVLFAFIDVCVSLHPRSSHRFAEGADWLYASSPRPMSRSGACCMRCGLLPYALLHNAPCCAVMVDGLVVEPLQLSVPVSVWRFVLFRRFRVLMLFLLWRFRRLVIDVLGVRPVRRACRYARCRA